MEWAVQDTHSRDTMGMEPLCTSTYHKTQMIIIRDMTLYKMFILIKKMQGKVNADDFHLYFTRGLTV